MIGRNTIRGGIVGAALFGVSAISAPAHAQAQAEKKAPTAEQAAKLAADAKELNRNGIAMLDSGDFERALDYFLRSRAVLPTTKNTTNAAIVLERLGRFDEALELYEELLLKYAGGLDDEDRDAIGPAMEALRQKVGSAEVSSNAGGTLVIDGRERSKLPLNTPVRVLAGKHKLRVFRVGYADFESEFEVEATKLANVDAKLEPLKGVGLLQVLNASGASADVFVDGVKLGTTPWEGALPPGKHLLWLRHGDAQGSAPSWVQVVGGQGAVAELQTKPLGAELTIQVEPRTATLELAGVSLGAGKWQGRLPIGSYQFSARESGYFVAVQQLEVAARGGPREINVKLKVDANHPRWPRARGSFVGEVFGGPLVGPSLNGGNNDNCPERCGSSPPPFGFQVGARGGYRFPFRLALEVGAGYMSLRQSVQRTETSSWQTMPDDPSSSPTTVSYQLEDDVHVHGPFVGVGISWRAELGRFYLGTRATVAVLVASSQDLVSGTAATTGPSVPVAAENNDKAVLSAAPYVVPEALGGVRIGPLDVGLSLGVAFFPAKGPVFERGRFGVLRQTSARPEDPAAVENSPESKVIDGERAYGRFLLFSPTVNIGAVF